MGWVKQALRELAAGCVAEVQVFGGSMRGRIESGQVVRIAPVRADEVAAGDVLLVAWRGNYVLHLAQEVEAERDLIANNLAKVNGWVPLTDVRGRVIE